VPGSHWRTWCLCCCLFQPACSTTGAPVVAFANDDASMEVELHRALLAAGIAATIEHTDNPADAYVLSGWGDEQTPDFRIIVDTEPADVARTVFVLLYADVQVSPDGALATTAVLNQANAENYAAGFFLDDDQSVRGWWAVSTEAGGGVVAGNVVSTVRRMANVWSEVYPRLLGCEECGLITNTPSDAVPGEQQVLALPPFSRP
jgi:hypothetical protein